MHGCFKSGGPFKEGKKRLFAVTDAVLRLSLEGGVGSKTRGC